VAADLMSDPSFDQSAEVRPGHSLHGFLVVAPIGCWSASLVLDIASWFAPDPALLVRISAWLVGAGLITATVAGVAGMVEAAPIPPGTAANRRVLVHLGLVMTALVLYAFGLILRAAVQVGQPAAPSTLAISAVGALLVGLIAYTGRVVRRSRRAVSQRVVRGDRPESGP
jgi:uncharacterized membrane protein